MNPCAGEGETYKVGKSGELRVSETEWRVREHDPEETVRRRVRTRAIARDLRRKSTPTEDMLWQALRRQQLHGLQFRRQHPIGPFVVDFVCHSARLVVEVDDPIHNDHREYDIERDIYLQRVGYTVLRIPADRVLRDLPNVLSEIRRSCNLNDGLVSAPPLPRTGEGVGGRGLPAADT